MSILDEITTHDDRPEFWIKVIALVLLAQQNPKRMHLYVETPLDEIPSWKIEKIGRYICQLCNRQREDGIHLREC